MKDVNPPAAPTLQPFVATAPFQALCRAARLHVLAVDDQLDMLR
jgi:hypothetical protein